MTKKEYDKQYKKKWRKEYPEKHREQQRLYRLRHPEVDRTRAARWAKNNPDKKHAFHHAWRAAKKAGGTYTVKEFKMLCKKYDNKCLCCHKKKKLTADHVIPISKGGANTIRNIQPLCLPCNAHKHTGTTDFRRRR